ncbi:prepilin peptidase [Nocardia caishijiensis]|uniref:Leader peptidase (Prepilin peptidase)/N-methyltransferase n=1 Tax=Nocardia caishijiensis TaxID=184756 RepID=A0ABQ6YNT4_9NOCA|nr:A24 family peptidase [Nocardia caishijiensis]KAF0847462.1 leader peptidase (prepilin peptidase)/N-methyltransferase [Nocardia caishijiensis]
MTTAAFCLLIAWCLLLGVIDVHARRLPNALTGTGAVAVFGFAWYTGQLTTALIGAALLTMPYLVTHLIAPAALGAGDVKLAIALGAAAALAGPPAWTWAAIVAPLLTGLAAAVVLGRHWVRRMSGRAVESVRRASSPRVVPHGPAMCLATVTAMALT